MEKHFITAGPTSTYFDEVKHCNSTLWSKRFVKRVQFQTAREKFEYPQSTI